MQGRQILVRTISQTVSSIGRIHKNFVFCKVQIHWKTLLEEKGWKLTKHWSDTAKITWYCEILKKLGKLGKRQKPTQSVCRGS